MAAKFQYDDPQMVHVGAFTNDEGLQRVAQKGSTYYHFTDRKAMPGEEPAGSGYKLGMVPVRYATIKRSSDGNVIYTIQFGSPTPASTLTGVAAALPADMRRKKFIIKGLDDQPVKL